MSQNFTHCFMSSKAPLTTNAVLAFLVSICVSNSCTSAIADCLSSSPSTPVTVSDETGNIPNSRQLVNGANTTVDTSTPGQIKVSLPNSGVTAGSYTSTNITVNAQGVVTAASTGGGGGGSVTSVSAADGTLTITPTTGAVTAKIPSSVALPGSPTTTTQNSGDNSSKIATTQYVDSAAIPIWKRQEWLQPSRPGSALIEQSGNFGSTGGIGNAFVQVCVDGSYALVVPVSTSSGAGSMAQVYYYLLNVTSQLAGTGTIIASPAQTANARYWIGFSDQWLGNSSTPPSSSNVACFRYAPADGDTTWHFVTNDASGNSQDTDTGITPSTSVNNRLQVQLLPSGGAQGFVDGALKATNTTHYPPVTNTMNFFGSAENTTSSAVTLNMGRINCWSG